MEPVRPDIPDFDLLRPIGRGGFGEVWLARNRTTGRLLAVKVIPLQQTGAGNPAAREISSLTRFEANRHCRHPNLLPIHHVGQTASHLFYVMDPADDLTAVPASESPEYQPASLERRLQDGPLSAETCLNYARQLLAGLASLHAAGMVHRDVKPANCLFVGGQLKLADFGLLTESNPLVSRLGTRKYMPPDGQMDVRADVYAAGLVLYEMISGLPADEFPRLGHRSAAICRDPILAFLLHLSLQACEREPANRWTDARAMLANLERPIGRIAPVPRRRWLVAAVTAALLATVAVGAWFLIPSRVAVNFLTDPQEAKIYVDDFLLVDSEGLPYTTPCTVDNLAASVHRVAFESSGRPRWDAGRYDLSQTRQIFSQSPQ